MFMAQRRHSKRHSKRRSKRRSKRSSQKRRTRPYKGVVIKPKQRVRSAIKNINADEVRQNVDEKGSHDILKIFQLQEGDEIVSIKHDTTPSGHGYLHVAWLEPEDRSEVPKPIFER